MFRFVEYDKKEKYLIQSESITNDFFKGSKKFKLGKKESENFESFDFKSWSYRTCLRSEFVEQTTRTDSPLRV